MQGSHESVVSPVFSGMTTEPVRVRLTSVLQPGSSASAVIVTENGQGCIVDSSMAVVVHDAYDRLPGQTSGTNCGAAFGQNFGLPGEIFKVKRSMSGGRYEIIGSQGLHRWGIAQEDSQAGGVISADVYSSPLEADCMGSASGVTVAACTKVELQAGDSVPLQYHPEMKNWMIVATTPSTPPSDLRLVRAKECFHPGLYADCDIWTWAGSEGWQDSGTDQVVHDFGYRNFLLPGEYAWAKQLSLTRFELVGSQGLFRWGVAQEDIRENSDGVFLIVDHAQQGQSECEGVVSNCQVQACNYFSPLTQSTNILSGEYAWLRYVERQWHVIYGPQETVRVTLEQGSGYSKFPGEERVFKLQSFDSTSQAWSDTITEVTVVDPNSHVCMFEGESHYASRFRGYHFSAPFGLRRYGEVTSTLSSGSSGTFQLYNIVSGAWSEYTGMTLQGRNRTGMDFKTGKKYVLDWFVGADEFLAFPYEIKTC